ncbi:MAG: MFS transporter [Pseudomonadota bacterium]
MRASVLDSRAAWTRLAITLAAACVANAGMWAIIVILPDVQAEFGTGRAEASLPYTLTMIGFALGNFLIGQAVDRFGVALSLVAAAIGVAAGFGLAMISTSILALSAAQLLIGLCSAVGFGPLIADISHWFLRRRGVAVALVASGNYLSGAIWSYALAGLLTEAGWRGVYGFLAIVTLAVVIPLALLLRRSVPDGDKDIAQSQVDARAGSVGIRPPVLAALLGLAGVGCCVAMSMPQVHIIAYCVDLGYGPAAGAEMLSLMLLGGVVSRLISGLLADQVGGVWTLLIGSTLQMLALFLYLPSDGLIALYIISTVFGLSQGGIVPSYAVIVREYMPAREAGRWVGLVMMATIMGMALGGWLSAVIYDVTGSYQLAFWNGIAWNALNIGIMLWLLRRARGQRAAIA